MGYETAVGVMLVGSLFTFLILSINTDGQKHPAVKLFYILMTLWLVVGNLGIAYAMAVIDAAANTVTTPLVSLYRASITIATFMTIYYIIYFIKAVLEWMGKRMEDRHNQKSMDYEA